MGVVSSGDSSLPRSLFVTLVFFLGQFPAAGGFFYFFLDLYGIYRRIGRKFWGITGWGIKCVDLGGKGF